MGHAAAVATLAPARVGVVPRTAIAATWALAAGILYWYSGPSGSGGDMHVPLADAFLHGRLHLVEDRPWLELVHWASGVYYVPLPPVPAATLMPAVAIMGPQPWHSELSPNAAASVVGGLNVGLVYLLLYYQKVRRWALVLLTIGFATTTHWWIAGMGGPHHYAQLVAAMFLLLALFAGLEGRWPFVAGLLLGLAAGSRLPSGLALPFILALYGTRPNRRHLWVLAGLAIPAALVAAYNLARFGDPFQFGYALIPVGDGSRFLPSEPWYSEGLISLSYIPRSLHLALLGWWQEGWSGEAITLTAPFLLLAVHARHRLAWWAWVAVAGVMLPNLAHGAWGFAQYGYRFILDATPILLVLLAWRYRDRPADVWLVATVALGAVAGLFGILQAAAG